MNDWRKTKKQSKQVDRLIKIANIYFAFLQPKMYSTFRGICQYDPRHPFTAHYFDPPLGACVNFVPPCSGTCSDQESFDPALTRDRRDRSPKALSHRSFIPRLHLSPQIPRSSDTCAESSAEWNYQ